MQRPGEGDRTGSREEAREDWQQHLDEAREDRQQAADDRWEEVDWDEVHIYDDDEFEWNTGSWMLLGVGTAITVTAFDTMTRQPGCNLHRTEVAGTVYYRCGSTWYIEAISGGAVRYVAVEPPPGY